MEKLKAIRRKIVIRRIIELILFFVSITVIVILIIIQNASEIFYKYIPLAITAGLSLGALVNNLFCCKIYYVDIDGDFVVIFRELLFWKLMINETIVDKAIDRSYLEGNLSDGTRIVASYKFINSFHVTFSDNRPSFDM